VTKRSYDLYCPVAEALDVVGDRWALLIVRDLLAGPLRFRDLQTRLEGIPPNILSTRLRELEEGGLIRKRELPPPAARSVYELTHDGRALEGVVRSLAQWGMRRLSPPTAENAPTPGVALRAALLAYSHPRAIRARRRAWRVVIDDRSYVLRLDDGEITVERDGTGEVDLELRVSGSDLMRLRIGDLDLATAKRRHAVTFTPTESERIEEFERVFALDLPAGH
jgi:DNA-binding HxlR family transcriptional regulator